MRLNNDDAHYAVLEAHQKYKDNDTQNTLMLFFPEGATVAIQHEDGRP